MSSPKLSELEIVAAQLASQIKKHIVTVGEFDPKQVKVSVEAIHTILSSAYCSGAKNKINVINKAHEIAILLKSEFQKILISYYPPIVTNHQALCEIYLARFNDDEGKGKARKPRASDKSMEEIVYSYPLKLISEYIVLERQAEYEVVVSDPWLKKPRIDVIETAAHIHQQAQGPKVQGRQNEKVVADFQEHFPELDAVLDWLMASRFCTDRKQCYLWLHCPSDWGKSLLLTILRESRMALALNVVEARKAFNGDPLALRREDFRSPIVIVFDEFDRVISEMKLLQNEMYISPKFGSRVMVPLYAKLFMSKEAVMSLGVEQGIEEQMANRMCYIEGKGVLSHRPVFRQSKANYYQGLAYYVTSHLKASFDRYVAMGRDEAGEVAQGIVERFYTKHAIAKSFGRFNDMLAEHANNFGRWIFRTYSEQDELIWDGGKACWFLKGPHKVFEDWVERTVSSSQRRAMHRAYQELIKALSADGEGCKQQRVNGISIKAVKLRDNYAGERPLRIVKK